MDKGARFYCCDFQVHTPRDLNWAGVRPITASDRESYATHFVKACRSKHLGAVAITDHHDVTYFSYLKKAAQEELGHDGKPIAIENRLVIFPGMELTLGVPCQALILFDTELPLEFLSQAQVKLGIEVAPDSHEKHALIKRLDHIKTLGAIYDALDELTALRGRYIVFPNVSCGGSVSIMRDGFLAHYKDMPCVGGYLDHEITRIGGGDRRILDGKIDAYNFKALGIFPTSDNRQYDFARLGTNVAWVKWSVPTAEGLRQACLARQTRISHDEPIAPIRLIESVHVSSSKFLGPIDQDLNPQFNSLIGSRGTGKSSFLEYLRWGLCDQPVMPDEISEIPNFQLKRSHLIRNTLTQFQSTVTIYCAINGVRHIVRRKSDSNEILLKIAEAEFKLVTEEEVRELLPVQAYSQKQLSSVGVRADELMRFIETPIVNELSELDQKKSDAAGTIRARFTMLQNQRALMHAVKKHQIELTSIEQQLAALKGSLTGLGEANRTVLEEHTHYAQEGAIIAQWRRDVARILEVNAKVKSDIKVLPKAQNILDSFPHKELLVSMQEKLELAFKEAKMSLDVLESKFSESDQNWGAFETSSRAWDGDNRTHNTAYEAVQAEATSQQAILGQIKNLDERSAELKTSIADRESNLAALSTAESDYQDAVYAWRDLFSKRADLLEVRCSDLTALSKGWIRATLRRGCGTDAIRARLSLLLDRTGIRNRETKIDDVCNSIAESENPSATWTEVLMELATLIPSDGELANSPRSAMPRLAAAGFNAGDFEKIPARLPPEEWLEISLLELTDKPSFEYRQREADYIPFVEASAGQQATALLRVLLNQEGPPLIIDQPEDDLDNQVIHDIARDIWDAKVKRQLIFSSHNANLVVNGDADLVVVFDYRVAGDQSGGRIKSAGAIDDAAIRGDITTIMEGGKDAFGLRKEKYGF